MEDHGCAHKQRGYVEPRLRVLVGRVFSSPFEVLGIAPSISLYVAAWYDDYQIEIIYSFPCYLHTLNSSFDAHYAPKEE